MPRMRLVKEVKFSNSTSLSSNDWHFAKGNGNNGWGNNEEQNYLGPGPNAFVRDNKLVISARKDRSGNYTSARMTYLRNVRYGRVEVRAKLPKGDAIWPAIWMLPTGGQTWPTGGEIDIMEMRGQFPQYIEGTLHWKADNGDHVQFPKDPSETNPNKYKKRQLHGTDYSQGFHTFAIESDREKIRWFVDDEEYLDFNNKPYLPFNHSFRLILNVAVGGNFLGPQHEAKEKLRNTSFGAGTEMQIEHIRFFEWFEKAGPVIRSVHGVTFSNSK